MTGSKKSKQTKSNIIGSKKSKASKTKSNMMGSKKSKTKKNITSKSRVPKTTQNDIKTWGKFGSVWCYSKNHYMRLGTTQAFNVIQNELERNSIWLKNVKFMSKQPSLFGIKLKLLLK